MDQQDLPFKNMNDFRDECFRGAPQRLCCNSIQWRTYLSACCEQVAKEDLFIYQHGYIMQPLSLPGSRLATNWVSGALTLNNGRLNQALRIAYRKRRVCTYGPSLISLPGLTIFIAIRSQHLCLLWLPMDRPQEYIYIVLFSSEHEAAAYHHVIAWISQKTLLLRGEISDIWNSAWQNDSGIMSATVSVDRTHIYAADGQIEQWFESQIQLLTRHKTLTEPPEYLTYFVVMWMHGQLKPTCMQDGLSQQSHCLNSRTPMAPDMLLEP